MSHKKKKELLDYKFNKPVEKESNIYVMPYTYFCLITIITYLHIIIENSVILSITRKIFVGYENFINWNVYMFV